MVVAASFALALSLGCLTTVAQGAELQCGTLTEGFLGDLPSGGFVVIGQQKFLVGGVMPRNVRLPLDSELRIGSRYCAEGEFRPSPAGAIDLFNGRVFAQAGQMPGTSTSSQAGSTPLSLALMLAGIATIVIARWLPTAAVGTTRQRQEQPPSLNGRALMDVASRPD